MGGLRKHLLTRRRKGYVSLMHVAVAVATHVAVAVDTPMMYAFLDMLCIAGPASASELALGWQ